MATITGGQHVNHSLQYCVGKMDIGGEVRGDGRVGVTGDGRDEGGGRVGDVDGVVVVCQTCGRSFSRLSELKRHSCDSVRSKKISVSGR